MAQDERNFRSTYYEKVGFRSVEEIKSLKILLKDKPLDKAKLKQFSLRFSVPASYQNLIWKILLGVLPVYCDSHDFIMGEHKQECIELLHALQVMKVIDSTTPKSHVIFAMWMLQSGNLRFNGVNLNEDSTGLVLIIQSFQQFFHDDTDAYWLTKCFYERVRKFQPDYPKLVEATWNIIEKEDSSLYSYLHINKLKNLPIEKWFNSCFAGILTQTALGKIWDKLCGGSCKILVFVVVMLLMNQRRTILKCKDTESVISSITNLSKDVAETIANKSIDMWQQYGSPISVHDKPKP